jgi:hypothetical protein
MPHPPDEQIWQEMHRKQISCADIASFFAYIQKPPVALFLLNLSIIAIDKLSFADQVLEAIRVHPVTD